MKKDFKPMSWKVKNFNMNSQTIEDYDVLKYREGDIKKLKKQCVTREEFAEELKHDMMWQYCSRSQYELIIEITDDNHIILSPWVGCREPEKAKIDVTDDESFDWKGFAECHIDRQIYKDKAKIDSYNQLQWVWDDFVSYCWYTRLKYERKNPKFDK